jgi:hypothetical protein
MVNDECETVSRQKLHTRNLNILLECKKILITLGLEYRMILLKSYFWVMGLYLL